MKNYYVSPDAEKVVLKAIEIIATSPIVSDLGDVIIDNGDWDDEF